MTRLFLCSAVIALALTIQLSARQQVFRAESQTVNVFATVTDKDRLVTDLKQENFQVFDNGRPQSITVFDNSPRPVRLIILIDLHRILDLGARGEDAEAEVEPRSMT